MVNKKLTKDRIRCYAKLTRMLDLYRRALRAPRLSAKEIDEMRKHVICLAQTLCEHVWGNRFY